MWVDQRALTSLDTGFNQELQVFPLQVPVDILSLVVLEPREGRRVDSRGECS